MHSARCGSWMPRWSSIKGRLPCRHIMHQHTTILATCIVSAVNGRWRSSRMTAAIFAQANYADAINNRGTALEEMGRRDEAMACYRQAFSLDKNLVSPPWNIALLQLLRGEYDRGWPGYENRWRQKKQIKTWRDFEQPVLIDLPIEKDTRVLLHAEQGFGDAIQFCRHAPAVCSVGCSSGFRMSPAAGSASLFACGRHTNYSAR